MTYTTYKCACVSTCLGACAPNLCSYVRSFTTSRKGPFNAMTKDTNSNEMFRQFSNFFATLLLLQLGLKQSQRVEENWLQSVNVCCSITIAVPFMRHTSFNIWAMHVFGMHIVWMLPFVVHRLYISLGNCIIAYIRLLHLHLLRIAKNCCFFVSLLFF